MNIILTRIVGNTWRALAMRSGYELVANGRPGAIRALLLYMLLTPGNRNLCAKTLGPRSDRRMDVLGHRCAEHIGAGPGHHVATLRIGSNQQPDRLLHPGPMSYWLLKSREGISAKAIAGMALTLVGIVLIFLGRD